MENKVSLVFTDKQKEDMINASKALDVLLTWAVSLGKDEISRSRILSLDEMVNMPKAYSYITQYNELFPDSASVTEFKKDIDLHPFVIELIKLERDRLRKLEDTEIRLRQEMDDFGRYARDAFDKEAKRKPQYKTALDFFKSIFNRKHTPPPKDGK